AVRLTTHGVLDLDAISQVVAVALEHGERHGAIRFLVDHRDIALGVSILEIHELPKLFESQGLPRYFRVALLFKPVPKTAEYFRFHENRSASAGFLQCVFTDEPEALDWLGRG
ncbi:MAG: hypothetical protein NHG36_07480, partial [Chromatiaceae bacterium]|nr:hypothetical protein [Candidatus Thioaporhodococcus sediminis]